MALPRPAFFCSDRHRGGRCGLLPRLLLLSPRNRCPCRTDEAIAQRKIAIQLDPDVGNPCNDIGVYLLDRVQPEEAVPWLEKAIGSKRYCCYQYPDSNLGRLRLRQGKVEAAKRSIVRSLEYDPYYLPALLGLELFRRGGSKELQESTGLLGV